MSKLAPTPVHLTQSEREQLQQLVNRHSTPQPISLREQGIEAIVNGSCIPALAYS